MRWCNRLAPPGRSRASSCRLVARNNEVLATKTTGADGRVDFDPGLSRGKGGSAPGLLVATLADDYGFLSLAQNAFDLTDRGVTGRDPPAALDAFLYTERGVYRSGETVFATALLRDAKGVAKSGLPLTLVVKRPDGVEYKRATVPDQGLGGRAYAIPLLPGSAAGKWSIEAYADPKGDSIGRVEFLLEDYVPERLDFTLHPAKPSSLPASRSNSRSTRGFSMARRRAGSTSPAPFGCRSSKARSSPAFRAMSPASPTMISPPSRTSSPTRFRPTTRATPIFRSNCPKARARARWKPS